MGTVICGVFKAKNDFSSVKVLRDGTPYVTGEGYMECSDGAQERLRLYFCGKDLNVKEASKIKRDLRIIVIGEMRHGTNMEPMIQVQEWGPSIPLCRPVLTEQVLDPQSKSGEIVKEKRPVGMTSEEKINSIYGDLFK